MKTPLERKMVASLKSLAVPRRTRLLVGVSGGADSIALADALAREQDSHLTIAHLNHHLRGDESDKDAQFVALFASSLKMKSDPERSVDFTVESQDIARLARNENRNLEAVARERRYEFLGRAALATDSAFVVTAHTRDDQVETICMRLIRGTGPEGLRGIYASRPLPGEITLIRPLLGVTRREVLDHCAERGLEFRTDSSNFSEELLRNRVRHDLLPHLRSFNPRLDEALLRTAALIAEDDELINYRAVEVLKASDEDGGGLNLWELQSEPAAVRRRVLRLWLRKGRGDLRRIDRVHLAAVERLMLKGEGGRRIELPGGFSVTKKRGSLILEKTNLEE